MSKNVTTMKDVAFKLTIFCCSYLPNIDALFYIKPILKALFCIKKIRRNIKKNYDKTFNQNSLYFFFTQVQHYFHISQTQIFLESHTWNDKIKRNEE
jgi:hypothetical protein